MNPTSESPPTAPPRPAAAPADRPSWWTGRSEVFVGLLVIGIAVFMAVQTAAMHVPDTSTGPGPRLFPGLVSGLMLLLGSALVVQVVRTPAAPAADGADTAAHRRRGPYTDWRTVGTVLGAVAAFALLLQPLGWLLSGALLFFGVAWAFGGRRPLYEAAVALVYSSVVQLAFVGGLGLNLPSGILGGLL
ncbi:tripartite tricarboxylate transporter TctB family protein [Streptomonospora nanhaiensis]|uniref:Putative tricarboxylic transport membrane protein n=1 Tax=Streptomonospora nanhaiensis TaxID=1323731 RepID=A0A853BGL1_9ACTN|nr:tripartite tricarboxylate transporter TctB family protein [Streptomonospora nanhaiensis]MBV2365043.1 tripartite tricarboxylate transporter TctB family protein [Streptomonospora nanhaiensis]MBX9388288.1 tripartite tricarboxylate transporter TctB family protein [Streptomonospora nanhaiensis]NYI94499.1 putative tricarboxylic transport membrane protein [Streptomonospora nanhaiensis]